MSVPKVLIGFLVALALTGLVVGLLLPRSGRVSMELVKYTRWPHGAMLQLSNGTLHTVLYLAVRDGTPMGSPSLCRQKTPTGWSNASPAVKTILSFDPTTGMNTVLAYLFDPAAPPKPGDHIDVLLSHELKPSQAVEFFVRLQPDALPKRVGTICYVPESPLMQKLRPWLSRIQQRLRITPVPPGQLRVWCPEALSISLRPPPATGN